MVAMDFKIPLSNFEGATIALVKSTCPKGKIKSLPTQHQEIINKNYKIIPIEVSCPIALQMPEPLFTTVLPGFSFLQYHYKATLRKDGFKNKFSPPPQA